MPLDGLRAWIGEVERKLGMRTRVFLALTVIAIGIGGGAIYLAIDARESSVSQDDVQALQEQLEARIGGGGDAGVAGTEATRLEVEIDALRAEVEKLKGEGGGAKGDKGGGGGTQSGGGTGGASADGTGAGGGTGGGDTSSAKLQELLEQAKDQNAQAEEGQSGK